MSSSELRVVAGMHTFQGTRETRPTRGVAPRREEIPMRLANLSRTPSSSSIYSSTGMNCIVSIDREQRGLGSALVVSSDLKRLFVFGVTESVQIPAIDSATDVHPDERAVEINPFNPVHPSNWRDARSGYVGGEGAR